MSQITYFCGAKFLAWKSGSVQFLDMAHYKVQKGPMCQTCVPVPLCRKIFGGKAHRLHVFFVAYDFVYEVFNVMYILFVSYTVKRLCNNSSMCTAVLVSYAFNNCRPFGVVWPQCVARAFCVVVCNVYCMFFWVICAWGVLYAFCFLWQQISSSGFLCHMSPMCCTCPLCYMC